MKRVKDVASCYWEDNINKLTVVDHPYLNHIAQELHRIHRVIKHMQRRGYSSTGCWKWHLLQRLYVYRRGYFDDLVQRSGSVQKALRGALESGDIVLTEQGKNKYAVMGIKG